ncbi:MAG TPA: hypothetical protein VH165_29405 [Kofleriaceae bacterium]|jgi:hypothetical protein|nr:hypothetical protein [Kofleriaceae bacterium]
MGIVGIACKGDRELRHDDPMPAHLTPPVTAPGDAGAPDARDARGARDAGSPGDAARTWPQLAEFPIVEPVRVIDLPIKPDAPRFDVGGPVVLGDVAIVSSSQLGFAAIDWRRGQLLWTKPAGLHVAPPIVKADSAILIGDCVRPPDLPPGERLLGCLRVVTQTGADESYAAIHGVHVDAFAGEPGPQRVWLDGDRAVRWRRGDQAVAIDLLTGVAVPAAIDPPPIHVVYRSHAWDITRTDERIIAREHGKLAWQTKHPYTALLGAVYLAELAPMLRVTSIGDFGGHAELNLLDIDATGSLHGQAAFPVPAISTLGDAIDAVGNTAIAVRMDASLHHDFLVGYAANALLMYVYPLPEVPRADPVGVAVAPDAVLVFHDGDTFTVLPELSAPPTAPGAPIPPSAGPSQNPTP